MRGFGRVLGVVMLGLGPAGAWGQTAGRDGGITLPGSAGQPGSGQTCVQVQIAGQTPSAFSCLNQQLQLLAEQAPPPQPDTPLAANATPNQVGTFNKQGVAEQYGQNFGKSVVPYRPPPPVYGNALH